jgi:antitoxin HicB
MAKARYHYNIMLRPEPEGGYTALVPALPGCVTYGRTVDEAREMAKDAISGYIASLRKHKDPIPTDDDTLVASLDLEYAEATRRLSRVRSSGFSSRTASSWITLRVVTSFFTMLSPAAARLFLSTIATSRRVLCCRCCEKRDLRAKS